MISACTGLGVYWFVENTKLYLKSKLVTNIETTTAPLQVSKIQSCDTPLYSSLPFPLIQEVYFPSITVCNINQVEGSFLKDIDIYGNLSQLNVLYDEYISGRDRDLTSNEESLLKSIQWIQSTNLTHGKSITEFTRYLAKKVMHVYLCMNLFRLMSF